MSFCWVLKNLNFRSKYIGVGLRFCRKSLVWRQKLIETTYFLVMNGLVYSFLWVLKKSKFFLQNGKN
jgi:hypothetical protein